MDVGLIVPDGFDAALTSGASPKLTIVLPASPSFGGDYVAAVLDRVTQALAGQAPRRPSRGWSSPPRPGPQTQRFHALARGRPSCSWPSSSCSAMIAVYALPAVLTEETEKRTVEALT